MGEGVITFCVNWMSGCSEYQLDGFVSLRLIPLRGRFTAAPFGRSKSSDQAALLPNDSSHRSNCSTVIKKARTRHLKVESCELLGRTKGTGTTTVRYSR